MTKPFRRTLQPPVDHDRRSSEARSGLMGLTVILAFAALVSLFTGCESKEDPPMDAMPATTAGKALKDQFLSENKLQGRIVLIEFGIIGCELSEKGLDAMIQLHREDTIPQLGYARVEGAKDGPTVNQHYADKSLGFTLYRDPEAALAKAFDATAYPTFVLLDKCGRVRYRGKFPDKAKLSDWVATLIVETQDPQREVAMFGSVELDVPKLLDSTKIPNTKGEVKSLREYMGPKGLFIIFVDTTCPFSREIMADIQKIAKTMAQHDVPSVLVNLDDAKNDVLALYTELDPGAPVLYDVTTTTKKKWDVHSVPTVVLVDTNGSVGYRGKAVWDDVSAEAEKALKLPPGSLKFGAKGTEFG
ncbi:MAG TPA: redoxin domain-containing protein [Phycisphaerae bacterium]|nr:redoxin domain-containing protein [Phycisphaerae bacterium]